jgi:hypothetical protein
VSEKRIVTIGCELASDVVKHVPFSSKSSLLDWDIVLFKPEIDDFIDYGTSHFQGKPSLGDTESFRLRECCEHWRREIKEAVEAGKVAIVFLSELTSVYIDTGERSYSGTGRNQRTTRHVSEYSNYRAVPADLAPVAANGTEMKLASNVAPPLATFWSEFRSMFAYHVLLTSEKVPAAIVTRTGDKVVGALYRTKTSSGTLVLLPDFDFYPDDFVAFKDEKQAWTKRATTFANRFVAAIVQLDRALRAESDMTPEPNWATSDTYLLAPERSLRSQLMAAELELEKAQRVKEELAERLRGEALLRGLLFEKGKPLEGAIIDGLRKLGFKAEPFKEDGSEFDVVFESEEGRLIGEAEGKDNKAINVDKLRQLQMNIHEDLLRESVSMPAKPVLFGNSYRLVAPSERGEPFTEKCAAAAATMNTALVSTPDLFTAVQHFVECQDLQFAAACRSAVLSTIGRVVFPAPCSNAVVAETTGSAGDA